MPAPSHSERSTQDRVVDLFTDAQRSDCLGYRYLGNWSKRQNNSPVEPEIVQAYLKRRGYTGAQISAALHKLERAAEITSNNPYQANLRTYQLLRYGVEVQTAAGQAHETVHLVDWSTAENNDFAIAEEVTLKGGHERRPDIVLYLNGIAVGVIELKRSSVAVLEGVRQLCTNQETMFNEAFFTTVQLVFAGSDAQGLRYGTVGTPEKFYVEWKAGGEAPLTHGALLDRPLAEMCAKYTLLDIILNFVIFDAGMKKVPRPHQFAGILAARERIQQGEGGVIWHTQGSGKSILMVLLAKWLLEHDPEARILIVTDRDELDKQIEGVMRNAGVIGQSEASPRITSRRELVEKLGSPVQRVLCALLHKFSLDFTAPPPPVRGRFYVFVDECHRNQGGDMNRQMKRWLKEAIFLGFTGTPLLRKDKQMTSEVFGSFIHTYKFHEAVEDGVVLDLKYEARKVEQSLLKEEHVDEWFAAKTRGLNSYQRAVLKMRWATLEELMSSQERKQRIVANIIHDFDLLPRLSNDRGTAILVAASIYDACHYFRLFSNTPFGKYCGIITSFEPNASVITTEPPNSDERYKYDTYVDQVLKGFSQTTSYETEMKRRFIHEPANLKLLIVVSKLLTGFDAPSCSYIYLDNEMRDHTLFQAICRTNRLDGEDKQYGHIVDYKELFQSVQNSIAVYTSEELDTDSCGTDGNVEVKDWLEEGRKNLEAAREVLRHLCEPVPPPKGQEQHLRYFCGSAANPDGLSETEPLRIALYKSVASFLRAYAEIAAHLNDAGYGWEDAADIQEEKVFYVALRGAIKQHAGEELDIKAYEGDMRHLINTYVQAEHAELLGKLSGLTLTELIVETGINDAIAKKLNSTGKLSRNTIAEGIINNLRKTIIRDQLSDPKYYDQMSKLLQDLIEMQRRGLKDYEAFLQKAEALAQQTVKKTGGDYPAMLHGNYEAVVLYQNLPDFSGTSFQCPENAEARAELALKLDQAMREQAPADWRDDDAKERRVRSFLFKLLNKDREATIALYNLIRAQAGY